MWGAAPRASLVRALLAGKLFHFDINLYNVTGA
jgi:hypothetical protein